MNKKEAEQKLKKVTLLVEALYGDVSQLCNISSIGVAVIDPEKIRTRLTIIINTIEAL